MQSIYFKPETEILFPHWAIPQLTDLRNGKWQDLAEYVASLPETHEDSLAFGLMMIKICGCLNCNPGGYKASLGCMACSRRTVGMVKKSDSALLGIFRQSQKEVRKFLAGEKVTIEA